MRAGMLMFVVALWLLVFACEMFATGGTSFNVTASNITNPATANQSAFMEPTFQESTNVFSNAWAVMKGIGTFLAVLVPMLALWCPTVFSGNMLWVWYAVCLPIDIAMVFAIMSVIRGVPTS